MPEMMKVAPLTWHTFFTTWQIAWWWDLAIGVSAIAYLAGVLALRARRQPWTGVRTVLFGCGLAVLVVTVNSAVNRYAHPLFWMHMVQHLLLIMVVPALLVAGQPLRLATSVLGDQGRLARLVRSRAGVIAHPLVAAAVYTVVIVGTHLTSFMQLMLTHPEVHEAEKVLYLASGWLLLWPLIGHEPVRHAVAYPLRLGVLFMAMSVDTFVGLILMLTGSQPFPGYIAMHQSWEPAPIVDLHYGGALMWCGGDAIMFLICLAIALQWIFDNQRRDQLGSWLDTVRRSALAGPQPTTADTDALASAGDLDADDRARRAYNAMLARLDQHHRAP
jgi:putative membrane protein